MEIGVHRSAHAQNEQPLSVFGQKLESERLRPHERMGRDFDIGDIAHIGAHAVVLLIKSS